MRKWMVRSIVVLLVAVLATPLFAARFVRVIYDVYNYDEDYGVCLMQLERYTFLKLWYKDLDGNHVYSARDLVLMSGRLVPLGT